MSINVNLAQLSTLNNTSILGQVNANSAVLTTALTDALSRSGQSPNQMLSTLDMNNNQIINLPPPSSTNSPARLIDVVTNPTITIPPVGTSGATVPLLNGNNTWSGTNTFPTINGLTLTASTGVLTIANGKTVTHNNTMTLQGTDSIVATFNYTDIYIGQSSTNTLTNKTFDTAGAGNVFKINGLQITANTGTGSNVLATSPTIATPTLTSPTINSPTISAAAITGTNTVTGTLTVTGTTIPLFSVTTTGSTNSFMQIATSAATLQAGINLIDNGTTKWQLMKHTTNAFLLFDASTSAAVINATSGGNIALGIGTQAVQFSATSNFAVNGAVATTLGSVGPTGASTTVVKWLTFVDAAGGTRYVPCF